MRDLRELDRIIEETRIRLNKLIESKAFNMRDPAVITLSEFMDQLIVEYEKTQ